MTIRIGRACTGGVPTSRMDEDNLPPLVGIPAGMKQEVAVSDAKDRPQHDFKRDWESDAERAEVTGAMEGGGAGAAGEVWRCAGWRLPAHAAKAAAGAECGGRPVARKKVAAAPAAEATALSDETLQGYTLSYGGAPTFVLQASSPGAGGRSAVCDGGGAAGAGGNAESGDGQRDGCGASGPDTVDAAGGCGGCRGFEPGLIAV